MKRWSYGINSYYRTASLFLDEAPWYVFFVEWFGMFSCGHIPNIPFPDIRPRKRNRVEDCVCHSLPQQRCEDHDRLYTLKEWYGDLGQWYHVAVCSPLTQWAYERTKQRVFDVKYEELVKEFSDVDKTYFDEQERLAEEWKKEGKKKQSEEIQEVLDNLPYIEERGT